MEAVQKLIPFSTHDLAEQYARIPRLPWWARIALSVARVGIGTLAERSLNQAFDQLSRKLAERAMAVHTLVESIRSGDPADTEIDQNDEIRGQLDGLERELSEWSERISAVPVFEGRALAADASARCVDSARALRLAARELKGAIQAHDANVETLRRVRRDSARSLEEFDEQFSDACGV